MRFSAKSPGANGLKQGLELNEKNYFTYGWIPDFVIFLAFTPALFVVFELVKGAST